MTILVQDLNQWKGAPVLDVTDTKIGTLASVYVDAATDEWLFAALETGVIGFKKVVFVPLDQAAVGRQDLRVAFSKETVKAAPAFAVDEELGPEDEPRIFAHYAMEYVPADTPSGRRLARR
ncbi:PRC-barrel domain-containing protein [Kineococcus rubinsiae]|uniref:PRC-barrel domain-containing protein n=1 Tax=Kineococcus rubinsiae TaxID=2609562 RepID=UPI001430FCCB|nr:PRC-barrel domain-containing protein [Kineococcus rubinsiae]NIZ92725.1 PRC-barrel domain containing protein [Kineococcus rubinsiae]